MKFLEIILRYGANIKGTFRDHTVSEIFAFLYFYELKSERNFAFVPPFNYKLALTPNV